MVQNGEGRCPRKKETEECEPNEQEEICRLEEMEEFMDKKVDTTTRQLDKANNDVLKPKGLLFFWFSSKPGNWYNFIKP